MNNTYRTKLKIISNKKSHPAKPLGHTADIPNSECQKTIPSEGAIDDRNTIDGQIIGYS